MADDILYETVGPIRIITINRPSKMNSLDFSANDKLINAFKMFDEDNEARVAIITGSGSDSFCAGADLKSYTLEFATTPPDQFHTKYTNGYGLGGITRNLNWESIFEWFGDVLGIIWACSGYVSGTF